MAAETGNPNDDADTSQQNTPRGMTFESFINFNRFSNFPSFVPLIIYMPFGILLGILRLFIFLHAVLLFRALPDKLPLKRFILRVMLSVTGLPISVHGQPKVDKKKILVSNSVTNLDPFILSILGTNVMIQEGQAVKEPTQLIQCFNVPADENHDQQVKFVKETLYESSKPLLFFPERLKTNGKSGLLKFSDLPFELDSSIQPVTIQTSRLLFDVSVSTISSNTVEDIFWCLVLPFTLFTIKYLPVTEKKTEESYADFSNRVQSNMSKSMGVSALSYIHHDIIEYTKSKIVRQNSTRIVKTESLDSSPSALEVSIIEDGEMNTMLKQVKEVFPDYHSQNIIADLKETKDVDATITNILEGKVLASKKIQSQADSQAKNVLTKPAKFESNVSKRQLSFSERKQAMLEAARLKYKIKHGLL